MLRDHWNAPPGAPAVAGGRRAARAVLISMLVGMLSLGAAWAGSGLVPVGDLVEDAAGTAGESSAKSRGGDASVEEQIRSFASHGSGFVAGAAKVSMEPRPEAYGGAWETDRTECATFEPAFDDIEQTATHVADYRVRWAENSNCIYMGGYGIGPMNPITSWSDPYGLWVRSVAMSDGHDTLVMTLIDAVYWEARYNSMCGEIEGGCGWFDLKEQLATELQIPQDGLMFASTHSHTAPDFIGGWGGVPQWYMQQMTDSIKASVRAAVANMQPAVLEMGETIVRERNGERRDFYRSAEDDTFSWFRLINAADQPTPCTTVTPTPDGNNGNGGGNGYGNVGKDPAPTPTCEGGSPGSAIATIGAYAAHPVTADEGAGIADADFPAVFAKEVEDSYGGVGAFYQTGLGNMSPRGGKVEMGEGLASYVPAIGSGRTVESPDLKVTERRWVQPVTNIPLGSLGVTGFFDRTFNQTPASIETGKGPWNRKCRSASPVSVETGITAVKLGPLWITGGPGELFSNLTNTLEERNPGGITLALGLVNDGLGYIVQAFETDHVGRQGTGFVGTAGQEDAMKEYTPSQTHEVGISEYEDAYSIDHCFGDMTLETTIEALGSL